MNMLEILHHANDTDWLSVKRKKRRILDSCIIIISNSSSNNNNSTGNNNKSSSSIHFESIAGQKPFPISSMMTLIAFDFIQSHQQTAQKLTSPSCAIFFLFEQLSINFSHH